MTAENERFAGKAAFVTGAGAGIGRATALAFAAAGASVAVVGIPEADVRETARMIEQQDGRALAESCDVTRAEEIKAALRQTIEAFGELHIAFNNAGIEQSNTMTADLDDEDWRRLIDIDLTGAFLCMKHEIPLLKDAGGGAIVNTSSGAGVIGIAGQGGYAAAKWGVIGLTKSAALEYVNDGVRIKRDLPRHHRHPNDGSRHRRH